MLFKKTYNWFASFNSDKVYVIGTHINVILIYSYEGVTLMTQSYVSNASINY